MKTQSVQLLINGPHSNEFETFLSSLAESEIEFKHDEMLVEHYGASSDGHLVQIVELTLQTLQATGTPAAIVYLISAYWKTHQRSVRIESPSGTIEVSHSDDLPKAQLILESSAKLAALEIHKPTATKPRKTKRKPAPKAKPN